MKEVEPDIIEVKEKERRKKMSNKNNKKEDKSEIEQILHDKIDEGFEFSILGVNKEIILTKENVYCKYCDNMSDLLCLEGICNMKVRSII